MKHQRPVNLDLSTLSYPPMAIASILHRLSGVVLFLLFPVILYFLYCSLQDNVSFLSLQSELSQPMYKSIVWVFGAAWWYHVVAGLRHVLMDCGVGESLKAARVGAILVIGLGVVGAILLGVWLW